MSAWLLNCQLDYMRDVSCRVFVPGSALPVFVHFTSVNARIYHHYLSSDLYSQRGTIISTQSLRRLLDFHQTCECLTELLNVRPTPERGQWKALWKLDNRLTILALGVHEVPEDIFKNFIVCEFLFLLFWVPSFRYSVAIFTFTGLVCCCCCCNHFHCRHFGLSPF